ncbi:MAG: Zn-dependent hydrolase [Bacteroidetes bacterium 4572_112]|nr:MAG: Zn-dependent hydrolase [Bacteroidetes bacterium 4572_112]
MSVIALFGLTSCDDIAKNVPEQKTEETQVTYNAIDGIDYNAYAKVKLTADISHLSDSEKDILRIMFKVADIMDDIFWTQTYGDKDALLAGIQDENIKLFATINYGPWDILNMETNKPFLEGFETRPDGANFYPKDMTKEEFEAFDNPLKKNLYTLVKRDENGNLYTQWYHEAYAEQLKEAADLLKQASELAEDAGLKKYLALRAEALLTDKYQESDMAWMDMKTSNIDMVVGPIENYLDALFGYKAAHESFILVKDVEWSDKLKYYAQFLPQMQKELPVDAKYKQETPGSDVDLNAYDVVYYAGDCNEAGKTIAINLPNDEEVQLKKGSRKLQLKNAMRAKFEKILVPISEQLIVEELRPHIKFNAFFENTMFHEVSHGMGIKNTITGNGSCRVALKEQYSAIEEGKADILGLYLVDKLANMGELKVDLMDNYVTFMTSIFRSIRFGASSAHGKANLIRYNYFLERGAFSRNEAGLYSIDFDKMKEASTALTIEILEVQGNGDYEAAKAFVDKWTNISPELTADLKRLSDAGIPKDIYYEQGPSVLGL